jgi:hypothetical protein
LIARVLFVADTHELLDGARQQGHRVALSADDVDRLAADDPSLEKAYAVCLQVRIDILDDTGRTPAIDTLRAVQHRRGEELGAAAAGRPPRM